MGLKQKLAELARLSRDHSKAEKANSTKTIQEHYQELMAETDVDQLVADVLQLVREAGGISDENYRKFEFTVRKEAERGLDRVRFYLTNYLLAGSGLGVSKWARGSAT